MIVECENCGARYNVDPERIKDEGAKVRCSGCKNVFKIFKPAGEALPPAEEFQPEEPAAAPAPAPQTDESPQQPTESAADPFGFDSDDFDMSALDGDPGLDTEDKEAEYEDMDLSSLDEELAEAAPQEKTTVGEDDGFDFSSLEKDVAPDDADGDLDLSSLDDDLGLGKETGEGEEDLDFSSLDDLDLGGDDLGDAAAPASLGDLKTGTETEDEFDLSSLDEDLGLGDYTPGEKTEQEEDLDFSSLEDEFPGVDDKSGSESSTSDALAGFESDDLDLGSLDADLGLGDEDGSDFGIGTADPGADQDEPAAITAEDTEDGLDALTASDDGADDFAGMFLGEEADRPGTKAPAEEDEQEEGIRIVDEDDFDFGHARTARPRAEHAPYRPEPEIFVPEDTGEIQYVGTHEAGAGREEAKGKKKRGVFFYFLIFLFLLVAGAWAVYTYYPQLLPVNLPGEQTAEVGEGDTEGSNLIRLEDAKHTFVQNETEGQLLVITGLARNKYQQPRRFIRLKGILYDGKHASLAEKMVYCGNVLSEDELKTLSMEDINKRLNVRGGKDGSNMNIPAEKSLKFMVVFSQMPPDLAEYEVKALSSEIAE